MWYCLELVPSSISGHWNFSLPCLLRIMLWGRAQGDGAWFDREQTAKIPPPWYTSKTL